MGTCFPGRASRHRLKALSQGCPSGKRNILERAHYEHASPLESHQSQASTLGFPQEKGPETKNKNKNP